MGDTVVLFVFTEGGVMFFPMFPDMDSCLEVGAKVLERLVSEGVQATAQCVGKPPSTPDLETPIG